MPSGTDVERGRVAAWPRLAAALRALRTIVGAPDYECYLEHHAARHPGAAPLSPRDYYTDFVNRRFGGGGSIPTRCC